MRSIEKSKKRNLRGANRVMQQTDIESDSHSLEVGFRPAFTITQGMGQRHMGYRLHSASVDDKIMEVKRFQNESVGIPANY